MIVVTGTGRSGTRYMSQALTAAGIPCGHEKVYTVNGKVACPDGLVADSSWMAVPYVNAHDHVILVYRHPQQVIASMIKSPEFWTRPPAWSKPYHDFMIKHVGQLPTRHPTWAAEQFYVIWNRLALAVADEVWNIADPDWKHISSFVDASEDQVRHAIAEVPTDSNTRGRTPVYRASAEVMEVYLEMQERSPISHSASRSV